MLQKRLSKLGPDQENVFQEIKRLLTSAPALGLPDVKLPFNFFIYEKNHTALGSPHPNGGSIAAANWDPVASGWPPCLWALPATVTLIREADKLTLGQDVNVKVPHAVIVLMNGKVHKCLTSYRMAHY
jgi:hypothetical protein